jgi:benzodiazapine receptor
VASTTNSTALRYANIVFFILTVIMNSLAGSTKIIGGRNTADVSNANSTLITPAGYVFAIWGVIYILLGIFVVYQALPSQKGKEYLDKIGWLFILSSIVNIAWLFVWQYEYLSLSVLLIFALLVTLIAIYVRLGIGNSNAILREKLAVHIPFSVYLGWITVASIADVAATLVSYNWNGFGISPSTWAILIVAVVLVITMLMLATRKDIAYALVIIWALVGIGVNHNANQTVVMLTEVASALVAIALVATVLVSRVRKK